MNVYPLGNITIRNIHYLWPLRRLRGREADLPRPPKYSIGVKRDESELK